MCKLQRESHVQLWGCKVYQKQVKEKFNNIIGSPQYSQVLSSNLTPNLPNNETNQLKEAKEKGRIENSLNAFTDNIKKMVDEKLEEFIISQEVRLKKYLIIQS
jgi:hypothetical protein